MDQQVDMFGGLLDEDDLSQDKKASHGAGHEASDFLKEVAVAVSKSKKKAPVAEPLVAESEAAELTIPHIEPLSAPTIYTVTELAARLKDTLSNHFSDIIIQGEIADFKGIHRSGHLYFALKDEKSQVRAVMWKGALQKVPFEVKGGLEVLCTGRVDFYGGSGSLQIVVEKMEPVGMGALQLKFEQLKEKLSKEGLFAPERKRKIKALNWRVGIVTGRSTAALQDMLKIFRTRFPLAEVFLLHAAVQGEKAPGEIVSAIEAANAFSLQASKPLDVLIVGRGGGSYEDLFCFNDEAVARAIANSAIPVISAVGHEIDFTIADMVADRRAATPTHAAQDAVPDRAVWMERLEELSKSFERQVLDAIRDKQIQIDTYFNRLSAASPQRRLVEQREKLKSAEHRLAQVMNLYVERRKAQLSKMASVFDALSPLKVLDRGFSVTKDSAGRVIKSVQDVQPYDEIEVRLSDGSLRAKVLA